MGTYDGAFLTNSRGIAVISRIDKTPVPTDAELLGRIGELFTSASWDLI